ncbi:uncharacterized protein B0H18DRAFT_880598 [Fomitopsis serialis]|uniref:uncharacterized protein n=1 Tax=Fomitopsis serialis TaxID=139415 RepID=UPI0020088EE8|nr:uncharacterized protein B0H18DRAFT_880598 [Neoantrodia serialis]KAH9920921.1 hypothetical protein B0H18DRAFT_880598 [Neoantrodia serialis]
MTEPLDIADTFVQCISTLGGPTYAAEDVAWASSVPQGKILFEWLASQVQCGSAPSDVPQSGGEIYYQSGLDPIALHEQEVRDIRSDSMDQESELLESEARLLRHRSKSSKIAAKNLAQTGKTLQLDVEAIGREILQQDAKVSELCISTDTIVSRSARTASRLLDSTGAERSNTGKANQPGAPSMPGSLANISRLHESIASIASRQLRTVDEATTSLPTPTEVKQETARLHASLEALQGRRGRTNGTPGMSTDAYCAELDRISHLLESSSDEESKQNIINELVADTPPAHGFGNADVDVREEVLRAWHLDQAAILEAREHIIDETTKRLAEDLFPPLGALHRALAARGACTLEAEALVSVLLEELEEITDDVEVVNVKQQTAQACASADADGDARKKRGHALLEEELTELLKRTQGLRPRDAGPLVLLERDDIVKELDAVCERARVADEDEAAWCSKLASALAELSASHADLLSVVYDNAPVNTSPPFGLPPDVHAVEESTKQTTEHLNSMVKRLRKETQLSDRDKRKLTAFVEKWTR